MLIQIVGAGAATAAWIEVVGGGRVWARFDAAHISVLDRFVSSLRVNHIGRFDRQSL